MGGGNRLNRLGQVLKWLQPNDSFDGVIALDEAHLAKSLATDKSSQKSSKTALVSTEQPRHGLAGY